MPLALTTATAKPGRPDCCQCWRSAVVRVAVSAGEVAAGWASARVDAAKAAQLATKRRKGTSGKSSGDLKVQPDATGQAAAGLSVLHLMACAGGLGGRFSTAPGSTLA